MMRTIVARFPDREMEIYRRAAGDAVFRLICMDYAQAVAARRFWEANAGPGDQRLRDYADLAAELEAEILARLVPAVAGERA
jgi:hypothetical protein